MGFNCAESQEFTTASIAECLIDHGGSIEFELAGLDYNDQRDPYWIKPNTYVQDDKLLFLDRVILSLLFHYKKDQPEMRLNLELIRQIIDRIGFHPDAQENAIWHYEKEQGVVLHPRRHEEFKRPLTELDVILSFFHLWEERYITLAKEDNEKAPAG